VHLLVATQLGPARGVLVPAALGSHLDIFFVVDVRQADVGLLCSMDNLRLLDGLCVSHVMVLALTREEVLAVILIILEDGIRNRRPAVAQLVAALIVRGSKAPLDGDGLLAGRVVVRSDGIS